MTFHKVNISSGVRQIEGDVGNWDQSYLTTCMIVEGEHIIYWSCAYVRMYMEFMHSVLLPLHATADTDIIVKSTACLATTWE